jgi:hypothetical protein
MQGLFPILAVFRMMFYTTRNDGANADKNWIFALFHIAHCKDRPFCRNKATIKALLARLSAQKWTRTGTVAQSEHELICI